MLLLFNCALETIIRGVHWMPQIELGFYTLGYIHYLTINWKDRNKTSCDQKRIQSYRYHLKVLWNKENLKPETDVSISTE